MSHIFFPTGEGYYSKCLVIRVHSNNEKKDPRKLRCNFTATFLFLSFSSDHSKHLRNFFPKVLNIHSFNKPYINNNFWQYQNMPSCWPLCISIPSKNCLHYTGRHSYFLEPESFSSYWKGFLRVERNLKPCTREGIIHYIKCNAIFFFKEFRANIWILRLLFNCGIRSRDPCKHKAGLLDTCWGVTSS